MKREHLCALAVLFALAPSPAPAAGLSDVETFLGETAFDEAQVSPDGSRLAFLARRNDFEHDREVFTLWTIDLSRPGARPVRIAEPVGCSGLRWSPDGRAVTFLAAPDPEAGAQLFLLAPDAGAAPRRLTDPARFAEGIDLYEWLPDGSGLVLAAAESPDPASTAARKRQRDFYGDVRRLPGPPPPSAALFRLALADGRVERLAPAPFEAPESLSVSPDGRRLAVTGGGLQQTVETAEVALLPLDSGKAGGEPGRSRNLTIEEGPVWAGGALFVAGNGDEKEGRYTATEARMYRVDGGDALRLARVAPELPGYLDQMVPLADGSLLAVTTVSTGTRVSRVEPASGRARTLREQRGWISNLSASRDGGRIAFAAGDAHHFAEIYVAEGVDGVATARPVTDFNAALSRGPLPEIETVSWDGADGVSVEGVLFWPPGRKGEKGLPLVVDLHGGPFGAARTEALDLYGSYTSYPALLAARGFLVLNPNYRGSAGRGDEFARGIEGHPCSVPSEDVVRGVESLAARGWADRGRVGLIGYSGGGSLSKCLIGRTDLFRAACTGSGVWDSMLTFGTLRGRMWAETFYGGKAPWEDFERWWNESPVSSLGRVRTPTLIVSGELDGGSPAQSAEMYHDLVWRGVPAEYLVFPGERHVFSKPSHKRTKIRAELSWLEHYLLGKPRAELSDPTVRSTPPASAPGTGPDGAASPAPPRTSRNR
jgi:dipeptidyl aminopeptidase/acylaminoacyl peptidase